ncbi:hypothetical protein IAD21_02859 [Abditibacteriota bacterium]|nr:hypothetical protein IAD21_02859 [Abditibacteriota bacterium]
MKPTFWYRKARVSGYFMGVCTAILVGGCLSSAQAQTKTRSFDFGDAGALQANYLAANAGAFSATRGYGWLQTQDLLLRDRKTPDNLRRDFVWGKTPATFRVSGLTPGRYKLTVIVGDANYGDHRTQVAVAGAPAMPLLDPGVGEFATLNATINCGATCDINFSSPDNNWNVNALSLEPTTENQAPTVTKERLSSNVVWDVSAVDPTKPLLAQFQAGAPQGFSSTGLSRADYLKLITGEVDFWKTKQNVDGAIIDPYRNEEWQYATPAFAYAASALIAWDKRTDLLESAAKAMDWATLRLSQRKAATGHEDFYPPMLAHALVLLKPRVTPERAAQWETNLKSFDPYKTYRVSLGGSNWNIVSLSGEAAFMRLGLRPATSDYVEKSLSAQVQHFGSSYGLYLEGPMAYDLFPRLWLNDMLADGYSGPYQKEADEVMRRGAITSLFMQSPWGELPAGGRSAHHQWNEAEQCATYEIYAARALKEGDTELAGIYKRAAHLSLASMKRWVRLTGEMQIIKNWVDPAQTHAYEGYSAHSQYNLLPMAMLAIAYEHADTTEGVAEKAAPSDGGGFVLDLPELHKVFANAGGTYVEVDTNADHHYDATGLIRIHIKGLSPQLGPSDSVLEHPSYHIPANSPPAQNTGVGVSWLDKAGAWRRMGELAAEQIKSVKVETLASTPQRVEFNVIYEGDLFGVSRITEHYVLTDGKVELTTELADYKGALRYVWPVLADDGKTPSTITTANGVVSVSQTGGKVAQTFAPQGAQSVVVPNERYPNHNGWARLGVAEYPRGGKVTLVIQSKTL